MFILQLVFQKMCVDAGHMSENALKSSNWKNAILIN